MNLNSKKVTLKILDKDDYEAWKSAYQTQLTPKNKWDRAHRNQEVSKKKFNQLLLAQNKSRKLEKNYEYAVFRKDTKELIGFVMAMDVTRGLTHSAYLGYTLFNRHWGQGFATEALRAFFKIAFTDLTLHRLQAGIEPHNKRSMRVAKSLGMRREGISKKIVYLRNEWQDLVQFAITSEEVGIKWKGETVKSY